MKHIEGKKFNININRPKVLFIGNGLFYNDCNWDTFIDMCRRNDLDELKWNDNKNNVPYSIKANVACDHNDDKRRNTYIEQIKKLINDKEIYNKNYSNLKDLLELPFDAILTTNYTYQIENMLDNNFVNKSDSVLRNTYRCCTKTKRDYTFFLHTFNRVKTKDIWHLHGEERLKSSIVLTHDEYGRLSGEVRKYFQKNGNRYLNFENDLEMKSWLDYLIMGDVYVVGYGADFSEFVFWWLLGRRLREKSKYGSIYFYEPKIEIPNKSNVGKIFALDQSKVNFENLNFVFKDKEDEKYEDFYKAAVLDIKSKIASNGFGS